MTGFWFQESKTCHLDSAKEQLIAKHFTDEIDRACCRRWLGMKGATLEQELERTMKTLFFQLPQIVFPQKLLTVPGGSREGENFNLRHKSRDEILREMIDQGYNMKLSWYDIIL